MIRHILRLVWNRKTGNLLIMAEITLSFLVVFVVAALALFFFNNARQPLGFTPEDLWYVTINSPRTVGEEAAERQEIERQIIRELASMEAVERAAVLEFPPYTDSTSRWGWGLEGRRLGSEITTVSDGIEQVLGLKLVSGRWFQPGDDQLAFKPVLMNERLAEEIFADEDPVGRAFGDPNDDPENGEKDGRVIGIFSDFRKSGEFAAPGNMMLLRREPGDPERSMYIVGLRMQPGTPAQYEERILDRLDRVAPVWSFAIRSVEVEREEYRRGKILQLVLAASLAGFLVLMVGLGLLGVLWQSVTQRTQEIGLRRATGADARRIWQQILTEIMVVAALALTVGAVIALQLPLTGLLDFLTPAITFQAFGVALAFMMALALVCGFYPSWLATRVLPAEALHYD